MPGSSRPLTRREMLSKTAGAAAMMVVSQGLISCVSDATAATDVPAGSGNTDCVLTASLTEGPYFVDEKLNRSDIRTDPVTGAVSPGTPLALTFNLQQTTNNSCAPLANATVDVWHADAAGVYSDVSGTGSGRKFLRGFQVTDSAGVVRFTTVYPGWYPGRAVHIHFKVRLFSGTTKTYEFTSQFFMSETVTNAAYLQSPYSSRGTRSTLNANDGIYNGLTSAQKSALTLSTSPTTDGYSGIINLTVKTA